MRLSLTLKEQVVQENIEMYKNVFLEMCKEATKISKVPLLSFFFH